MLNVEVFPFERLRFCLVSPLRLPARRAYSSERAKAPPSHRGVGPYGPEAGLEALRAVSGAGGLTSSTILHRRRMIQDDGVDQRQNFFGR